MDFFIALLIIIARGLLFGFSVQSIVYNKGYEENWFWLGFFLGIIALLLALAKPDRIVYVDSDTSELPAAGQPASAPAENGWRCTCGRINPNYVGKCVCGRQQTEVLVERKNKELLKEKGAAAFSASSLASLSANTEERTKAKDAGGGAKSGNGEKASGTEAYYKAEAAKLDYLYKLRKMADEGVITEDEFRAKKKDVLNLPEAGS